MGGPDVVIHTELEREVAIVRAGRKLRVRAPLQPGLIPHSLKVFITVKLINRGDSPAYNLIFDNPIPPGTVYAVGSAHAEKGHVQCSVDGENFHEEEKQLTASDPCTDLRWFIDTLDADSSCSLEFQVVVENPEDL